MVQSITHEPSETQPTEPTPSRLRTVTGNRFPWKCARGCGFQIPRDPEVRLLPDPLGLGPNPNQHHPEWFGLL